MAMAMTAVSRFQLQGSNVFKSISFLNLGQAQFRHPESSPIVCAVNPARQLL
jgi:hypothetical protein